MDESKASELSNGRSVALTGTNPNCLSGDCNNGFGTYQFPSGNKYVGHFHDQQREGEGVFYFANGERFEGTFHNNNKSRGTYRYLNGATYTGTYDAQDNELNGTITGVNNMRIPVVNGRPQLPPEPPAQKPGTNNTNEPKKIVKRVCRGCWGRGSFSSHETFYDGGRKDQNGFTHFGETTTTLCGKCHGLGYIEVSQ